MAAIYFHGEFSIGGQGRQLLDELRKRFGRDTVTTRLDRRGPRDSMMSDAIASGVAAIVYVIEPGTKKKDLESVLRPECTRPLTTLELINRGSRPGDLDPAHLPYILDPDHVLDLEIPVIAVLVGGANSNVLPVYNRITPITLTEKSWTDGVASVVAKLEMHVSVPELRRTSNDSLAALFEGHKPQPAKPDKPRAAHEVFVSYAFEDQAFADAMVRALEEKDIPCWIASRDVPKGESYAKRIPGAIRSSQLVVVVVSEHSNPSEDVLSEVTLAKNANVPRLPLLIDDSPLDDGLAYFFSHPVRLYAAGMGRDAAIVALVEEVKRHLRRNF